MTEQTPSDLLSSFTQAINAGDLEGALALYDGEAAFMASSGTVVRGKEALRDTLAGFIAMKPVLTFNSVDVVQSGDTALVLGSWTLSGTGPDGSPIHLTGRSTDIHRRTGGVWRTLVDNPWGTGVLPD